MTLIIGIKCSDGVVVAADGAATLGYLGQKTALQPFKKLCILHNKIIIGVSGPVGLGQRIAGEIDSMWKNNELSGKQPYEGMTMISEKIRKHIRPELEMAATASRTIGNIGLQDALSATLVALPLAGQPTLLSFDQQGAPEEMRNELPFASIGVVQTIADPFLGFIRRIFWRDKPPTVSDGIFAAVWTLEHAILLNPGGVAKPIQVTALIELPKEGWIAKEYSILELQEHYEAMEAAEKRLATFREELQSGEGAKEIPKPS